MWWAGSETLYLGERGASREAGGGQEPLCWPAQGWSEGLGAWAAHMGAQPRPRRRTRVKVWLSGALARPFVLGPLQGLRGRGEVLSLAQAAAPEATGLAPGCDVWLGPWRADQGGVAVAAPPGLIAALQRCERELPLRLTGVEPWWNWALSCSLARDGQAALLAVDEEDAVTLLARNPAGLATAQTLVPRPAAQRLPLVLKRWAMVQASESAAVVVARHEARRPAAGQEIAPAGAVAWLGAWA